MSARVRMSIAGIALVLCTVLANAEPTGDVLDALPGAPSPGARLEKLDGELEARFNAVLAEYDALAKESPHDVKQQVGRCDFISQFASNYEYAAFIDKVLAQQDECADALSRSHPDHPEAILYALDQMYGEELLTQGRAALEKMRNQRWTNGQAARLYTMLARAANLQKDANATDYALTALDLDETSPVRLVAAQGLADRGDKARALGILTSPIDVEETNSIWGQTEKMKLLARLGASKQVAETYAKLEETQSPRLQIARALRQAGLVDLARKELTRGGKKASTHAIDRMELFRLELEHGTPRQALDAYNALRDLGMEHDPLAINRIAVALRSLALPWQPRDLLGFIGIAATILLTALVMGIPLSAVHYRGLVVRARLNEPYPTGGWQLRHAWMALVAFAVAQILALCFSGPLDFDLGGTGSAWDVPLESKQLASMVLVQCFLSLALLIPLAKLSKTLEPAWWGTTWTTKRSLLTGAGIGLGLQLPVLVVAASGHTSRPLQDQLWSMLWDVQGDFGIAATIWVLALAAPVVEEFVFRGVLLRAVSSHIPFVWANLLQATLFSAMHVSLKGAIPLFLLGALLGWLTRRSGGLLAPMALHCVFNLVAGLVMLH